MTSRYTNATLNNGLNGTRRNPVREALSPTEMLRDGTLGGVFGGLSYTGSVQYPFGKPPQTRGEYNTQKAWIEKVKKFCDEHILGKVDKQKVSNPVDLPEDQLIQQADDAANIANSLNRTKKSVDIHNPVLDNVRTGSSLKGDAHHAFNDIIDNYAGDATKFAIKGGDGIERSLYQLEGSLNGKRGVFEWIIDPNPTIGVTHRRFIENVGITGKPNARP